MLDGVLLGVESEDWGRLLSGGPSRGDVVVDGVTCKALSPIQPPGSTNFDTLREVWSRWFAG